MEKVKYFFRKNWILLSLVVGGVVLITLTNIIGTQIVNNHRRNPTIFFIVDYEFVNHGEAKKRKITHRYENVLISKYGVSLDFVLYDGVTIQPYHKVSAEVLIDKLDVVVGVFQDLFDKTETEYKVRQLIASKSYEDNFEIQREIESIYIDAIKEDKRLNL